MHLLILIGAGYFATGVLAVAGVLIILFELRKEKPTIGAAATWALVAFFIAPAVISGFLVIAIFVIVMIVLVETARRLEIITAPLVANGLLLIFPGVEPHGKARGFLRRRVKNYSGIAKWLRGWQRTNCTSCGSELFNHQLETVGNSRLCPRCAKYQRYKQKTSTALQT